MVTADVNKLGFHSWQNLFMHLLYMVAVLYQSIIQNEYLPRVVGWLVGDTGEQNLGMMLAHRALSKIFKHQVNPGLPSSPGRSRNKFVLCWLEFEGFSFASHFFNKVGCIRNLNELKRT